MYIKMPEVLIFNVIAQNALVLGSLKMFFSELTKNVYAPQF